MEKITLKVSDPANTTDFKGKRATQINLEAMAHRSHYHAPQKYPYQDTHCILSIFCLISLLSSMISNVKTTSLLLLRTTQLYAIQNSTRRKESQHSSSFRESPVLMNIFCWLENWTVRCCYFSFFLPIKE